MKLSEQVLCAIDDAEAGKFNTALLRGEVLLEADGSVVAKSRAMLLATNPQGFAGSYAAVRDMDMRTTIALIACPTLVIAG